MNKDLEALARLNSIAKELFLDNLTHGNVEHLRRFVSLRNYVNTRNVNKQELDEYKRLRNEILTTFFISGSDSNVEL